MIQGPVTAAAGAEKSAVVICRNPTSRALLGRLVPSGRTLASALEAVLAVARTQPRAVVLNIEDVEGYERGLLAALRRAKPDLAVYAVVRPDDEPFGRDLVRQGAADYFVMPGDVYRLPRALAADPPATRGEVAPPPQGAAAPRPEEPDRARLFEAACRLADLAPAESQSILRDGAAAIFDALGATRGCLFAWNAQAQRLELAASAGGSAAAIAAHLGDERTIAERALRTGETLFLEATGAVTAARPTGDALLCIPVRESDETFGVLCISRKASGMPVNHDDKAAAGVLAQSLARLYRGAIQREQFARLALRDAETGLLKPESFRTYLAKLVTRAAAQNAEVAVVVLEPPAADRPDRGAAPGRLGSAIAAHLAKGWQGARLSRDRFAVAWARQPSADEPPGESQVALAFHVDALASLGPKAGAGASLRTGVAVFPRDGADAETLLTEAEARLAGGA